MKTIVQTEWIPESCRSFNSLDFKQRVEALTSGACNYFPKPLILLAMQSKLPYTSTELYDVARHFYGENLDTLFRPGIPFAYCRNSLHPIGFVVKGVLRKGQRTPIAFAKTDDAERYALPIAAKFLKLAKEFDVSLTKLIGETNTAGEVRRGYSVTVLLEALSDGKVHTLTELFSVLDLNKNTVHQALIHMRDLGLVDYESVKIDTYGTSERGYSSVIIRAREKLDEVATKTEENLKALLMSTVLGREVGVRVSISNLKAFLQTIPQKVDRELVSRKLGINLAEASNVVTALVQLGIAEYEKFRGSEIKSSVGITPMGERAYNVVFKHVLKVARNPTFALSDTFRQDFEELNEDEVRKLLLNEAKRYSQGKKNNTPGAKYKNAMYIESVIRQQFGDSPVRLQMLRQELPELTPATIRSAVRLLRDMGRVVRVEIESQPRIKDGAVHKLVDGYYKLRATS